MADPAGRPFVELGEAPAESALRHFLARRSVLDQSPLAIVEVDLALRVLYANPTALTIVGADDYHDIVLDDVFPDAESQERLQLERARRREGLIGNYEVKVTRLSDRTIVPVEITAVPLANTAGEVTGSIAILRSLERRDLRLDIHRLNNEIDNGHALIARVSQRLKKVIPSADLVVVSRFSQGQRHARVIFAQPIETGRIPDRGKRWIPLSEHQIAWLHAEETRLIGDMEELLGREPWSSMRDDAFVRSLLNAGMKSSVRRSIVRGGKLVATFSLLSRSVAAFTPFHRDLLDEVPIEASVLQALDFEEKQLRDQRMRLIVDINRCTKVDTAAKLLAKRLVGIFGWAHVSIFKVEHSKGRICVIGQDYDEAQKVYLDRDYSQSIDTGILGRVVSTREVQNVPDVGEDKDYIQGVHAATVRSELCVPMTFEHNSVVRFIVNVEDTQENAFSDEEVTALVEIVAETSALIQRISNLAFLQECFDSSSDPLIVTDVNFQIRKANSAAGLLLGFRDAQQLTGPLSAHIADEHGTEKLRESRQGELGEWVMYCRGAAAEDPEAPVPTVPVYVVRKDLDEGIGGHIFIARDLRRMQREIELKLLEKTAYEIAAQAATPLTMVMAELEKRRSDTHEEADAFDNALRLLKQVQRSFMQLAMSNPHARPTSADFVPLDLTAEMAAVVADLPAHLRRLVSYRESADVGPVKGNSFQVSFVLSTLLLGLVRFAPSAEGASGGPPVRVEVNEAEDEVEVHLDGPWPSAFTGTDDDRRRAQAEAERQIALPLVEQFVNAHRARMAMQELPDARRAFELRFPVWRPWR